MPPRTPTFARSRWSRSPIRYASVRRSALVGSSCIRVRPRRGIPPRRSLVRGQRSGRLWPRAKNARCTSRTRRAPVAPWGARSMSWQRSWRRRARASAWACVLTPAICLPPDMTSAPMRRWMPRWMSSSGRSVWSGWARFTSTIRRRLWAQTATVTPMSAQASWARRAAPRSSRRPSFRISHACWRHPARTAPGRPARRSSSPASCTRGACAPANADHPRGSLTVVHRACQGRSERGVLSTRVSEDAGMRSVHDRQGGFELGLDPGRVLDA